MNEIEIDQLLKKLELDSAITRNMVRTVTEKSQRAIRDMERNAADLSEKQRQLVLTFGDPARTRHAIDDINDRLLALEDKICAYEKRVDVLKGLMNDKISVTLKYNIDHVDDLKDVNEDY